MDRSKGIAFGLGAYLLWGILPVFWKLLSSFGPWTILSFRIIHAAWFLVLLLVLRGQLGSLLPILRDRRRLIAVAAAAALITVNWGIYIWAVNNGHIVESSLGYFINPLVSIAMGIVFFHERTTGLMRLSIALALAGVVVMTISYGRAPWIALILAFSFALYGLVKKKVAVDATVGLALETFLLAPFALAAIGWMASTGTLYRSGAVPSAAAWAISLTAGVVTAIPLLLFGHAAQRLPLGVLGFLQYVSPTLQLLLGVFLYRETFTLPYLCAFSLIWLGLALFSIGQVRTTVRARA